MSRNTLLLIIIGVTAVVSLVMIGTRPGLVRQVPSPHLTVAPIVTVTRTAKPVPAVTVTRAAKSVHSEPITKPVVAAATPPIPHVNGATHLVYVDCSQEQCTGYPGAGPYGSTCGAVVNDRQACVY